jgi:UDP-N-acetylglucosamine 4,6-dehydratase/UDP-glucose 4-epimerase
MLKIQKDKLYLVTGGTGYLGDSLINYIIKNGGLVRVLSRNDGKLLALKEKYPSIEIYTGNVSDVFAVKESLIGVNAVFHLAAFKHVGLAEAQSRECIKTNTIGSFILYEESLSHNLDFILSISTDKAAQIAGVYGASKFLMEKLCHQYEKVNPSCAYRLVRYGNVLYSTGSVLCKWKYLIESGKKVIVTEPSATRFFWTVDQAIQLIEDCMINATDSAPYCPSMKSMKIKDLLQAMIEKYSNGQKIEIETIGLQPGENMHERVLEEGPYSNEVDYFTIDEIKQLI